MYLYFYLNSNLHSFIMCCNLLYAITFNIHFKASPITSWSIFIFSYKMFSVFSLWFQIARYFLCEFINFPLTSLQLCSMQLMFKFPFAFSLHFAQVSSGKGCLENPLQRKAVAVPGSTDANLELTLAEMGMSNLSAHCAFLPFPSLVVAA